MIVDDQRRFPLTNYNGAKFGKRAVDSDHVTTYMKINLNFLPHKPQRIEMFDFKSDKGKQIFKIQTTETTEFTDCFKNMSPVLEQCEKWLKTLEAYCKKAYPVIRIRVKKI